MPEGAHLDHTAAAMRAALCDRKMLRFDAPRLVGVVPRAGRVIERVESHGRHLHLSWDDGIVLHTDLRRHGTWDLHRTGEYWQGHHHDVTTLIEVPGWVAICYRAPVVETYRAPDARRHPRLGGLGPDLSRPDADLGRCVLALRAHEDPEAPVHRVLLDQRIFCGLGNVFRSEVLWARALSPFAAVGDLTETDAVRLVEVAARLLQANQSDPDVTGAAPGSDFAVYSRRGQRCRRCTDTIEATPAGGPDRLLYWCPGCQIRLDPAGARDDETREMDPHPAAAKYLAGLPWRRPV
jgi:endonuclease-8